MNCQSILDEIGTGLSLDSSSDYPVKKIYLNGLEVINASVAYKNRPGESGYLLSGINLRTGAITLGNSVPFSISSTFSWVDGGVESNLTLKGMLEAGLDGSKISLQEANLYASVGGRFLPSGASPGELTARVDMDWDKRTISLDGLRVQFLGLRAEGDVESGDLSKGLSADGHVTVRPFKPSGLITRYFPDAPVKSVDGLKSSSFASFFHVDESGVRFRDLALSLDDMTVRGLLGFKGYAKPVFTFGLQANTVDLDRYLVLFRTDTPFIWDDFNLELFSRFRGQGTIRADGFKVLDTLISDIRLSITADKDAILIDAGAIKKGQASLGGKTEVVIGRNNTDGNPVLSMSASITAESQKDGFAFLKTKPISLGGKGFLTIGANVKQLPCPPQARSIDLLKELEGNILLSLREGAARYEYSGKPYELDYSKADIALSLQPAENSSKGYYDYAISSDVKTIGGKTIESMAVSVQGDVAATMDKFYVKSSGMNVKGHLTSTSLPKEAKRLSTSGRFIFDTDDATLSVDKGFVRILDTSIKYSANVSGLDKDVVATGRLDIPNANPKKIIYLLSGVPVRTNDAVALKRASLQTRFKIGNNEFVLSELEGNLDGMSFNGHVVGNGFSNPMLSFSLSAGSFDLDRYLPPSVDVPVEERRLSKVKKNPPVDLPLGFLRALRLNGKGYFDEFKLAKVRAETITADIRADKGAIHIFDVKGRLHEGELTADLRGEVGEDVLATKLNLHVEDMQAGQLLSEMAKRDYIRGVTDIDVDLSSSGATDEDILKYLKGTAWVRVVNGSFKFSGYDSRKSVAKSNVATIDENSHKKSNARTVFQKARAFFTVAKGIFVIDKFRLEAPPLLQAYGEGNFSLPDNTVNVSVRNDFVAIPSVTIQIVGKLTDPEIKVPKGKIVNNTVRNILSLPEKSFKFLRDLFY